MNVIYIAHTKARIWQDTKYSILTLLTYIKPAGSAIKIWVFTDHPDYFAMLGVECVTLTPKMLQDWYGEIQFIHRQKFMAIQYVAQRSEGDIWMLDGDTLFRQDPTPLFARLNAHVSAMHVLESPIGALKTKSGQKIQKLAASNQVPSLTQDTLMYNAGVIGIARTNLWLEEEALQLTELLYRAVPLHIMEQLAHSIVLAQHTELIEAAPYIYHWWGRGRNVEVLLSHFFDQTNGLTLPAIIEQAHLFTAQVEAAPFNAKPRRWQKWKNWLAR